MWHSFLFVSSVLAFTTEHTTTVAKTLRRHSHNPEIVHKHARFLELLEYFRVMFRVSPNWAWQSYVTLLSRLLFFPYIIYSHKNTLIIIICTSCWHLFRLYERFSLWWYHQFLLYCVERIVTFIQTNHACDTSSKLVLIQRKLLLKSMFKKI